jgi:2-polyprenyl-3-methyl-5-hydroxy-6-metoxy-1,4-benzoquinol methylase
MTGGTIVMDKSLLIRIFGLPAGFIHGDTLVLDRWRWLKSKLPKTRNQEAVIDIGCGTGYFSIGASLRGYKALGLSWDERNQSTAKERAEICMAEANFEVQDVRFLDERKDLIEKFDVAICTENIEHIIDDRKLIIDIARCLKPGGRLLLTTPNLLYVAMTRDDLGPFQCVENGGHVRRGYSDAMLRELCREARITPVEISYCSGYFSQKITALLRVISRIHPLLGWACILPFRIIPPLLDRPFSFLKIRPDFSICMEAYKPRFEEVASKNLEDTNHPAEKVK